MNRLLFLVHRWAGVALALFMFLWFFSGLVIVYSAHMNQSRLDQLAHAEPLRLQSGWLSLGEVWSHSAKARAAVNESAEGESKGKGAGVLEARLLRLAGKPLWVIEDIQGKRFAISAVDGVLQHFSGSDAVRIAGDWLARDSALSSSRIASVAQLEKSSLLRNQTAYAPFHRVALANASGTELIVSARTGEIVHVSDSLERATYWAGNWLHMFRPLESIGLGEYRTDALAWVVGFSLLACLTGLIVGWQRWRPGWFGSRRYGDGRTQPYRAVWSRWHFWAGLIGGIVATLWAFSGFLNAMQSTFFTSANSGRPALNKYYGQAIPAALKDWQPVLHKAHGEEIVQVAWHRLGDQAIGYAYQASGERIPVAAQGFGEADIVQAVSRLTGQDTAGVATELLTAYDDYYYPRHRRGNSDRPLPVLRVDVGDTDGTRVYVNPQDGRLVLRKNDSRRTYRWLFSAIHHWDFPILYSRPLWDVWMLVWLGFGLVLGISSIVLGYRRLTVTLQRKKKAVGKAILAQAPSPVAEQQAP